MSKGFHIIDIHCHILPRVDDGAASLKESMQMLDVAADQGVKAIITTPHYRPELFEYHKEKIESEFARLKGIANDKGIRLFTGCEYHTDDEMIENLKSARTWTLAGSDFVLMEFCHDTEYEYICEQVGRLESFGYIPVIAHAERYATLLRHADRLDDLRRIGALIQLNADAVLGLNGLKIRAFSRKALKNEWVDFIASDAHDADGRPSRMDQCNEFVRNKYGSDYAREIFWDNPLKIIQQGKS